VLTLTLDDRQPERKCRDTSSDTKASICSRGVEANAVWSSSLNVSTLGIAVFNAPLCCVAANRALALMDGIPAEAHLGKTLRQIFRENAPQLEPLVRQSWSTGMLLLGMPLNLWSVEASKESLLRANLYPVTDVDGGMRLVAAVFSDVSAQERLTQRLLRTISEVELAEADATNPEDEERTEVSESAAELLQEAIDFLDYSGSLRCHAAELLLTGALRRLQPSLSMPESPYSFLTSTLVDDQTDASPAHAADLEEPHEPPTPKPSNREKQVMALLAEGKVNKEIAVALALSPRTVEAYRARLMAKLKVHSVAELVRYAVRNRIISA
jgi:DNA-binding CsgD family transcriptional regulator